MIKLQDSAARTVATELGGADGEGVDWVAITDAKMEIVMRYVSPEKYDAWETLRKEEVTKNAWVLDHVAYPSPDKVRERMTKRPVLASRMALAALELYGNTSELELGKAEL